MNLRRLLPKFVRPLIGSAQDANDFEFFDLSNLKAIGNRRGGLITNKAGRAVLRARHRGHDVKLYEAFSPGHAQFIAAVSAALPDMFPEVLELRGAWVMAEWVEGDPPRGSAVALQADMLRRIHAVPLDELPPAGFCYLRDLVLPRYIRAASLAGASNTLEDIAAEIEDPTVAQVVMHPDLSPANIIHRADGRIAIVDNELLCTGRLPLLDLCNAMRPHSSDLRAQLAALYTKATRPEQMERTARAWVMREAGAAFIGGQLERCCVLLKATDDNPEALLPFE